MNIRFKRTYFLKVLQHFEQSEERKKGNYSQKRILTLVKTPVPDEVIRLEVTTAPPLPALAPSLVKVVKMAGGEKGPLSSNCCPETGGIRTPQTRMVYSVLGSSPPARNWMSDPE